MTDEELKIKVNDHFKAVSFDMPKFSKVDGYLLNENSEVTVWLERKTRNVSFDTYPDVVVDAAKFFALIEMEDITTLPAVIAYGWSCGTWGIVRPVTVNKFTIESLTPRQDSVSLNKGVKRDVVKIDKSEFELHYGN